MKGSFGGETPIVALLIFVNFSLFLISTHSENLIHLAATVKKFINLEDPIEGIPSTWHPRLQSHTCPP